MSKSMSQNATASHREQEMPPFAALYAILPDILILTRTQSGVSPDQRLERLASAVNKALDLADNPRYGGTPVLLSDTINRARELSTANEAEGIAMELVGDLRADSHNRLVIDDVLRYVQAIPENMRTGAFRNGSNSLQRVLALLLLHSWVTGVAGSDESRATARQAIVAVVQGIESHDHA